MFIHELGQRVEQIWCRIKCAKPQSKATSQDLIQWQTTRWSEGLFDLCNCYEGPDPWRTANAQFHAVLNHIAWCNWSFWGSLFPTLVPGVAEAGDDVGDLFEGPLCWIKRDHGSELPDDPDGRAQGTWQSSDLIRKMLKRQTSRRQDLDKPMPVETSANPSIIRKLFCTRARCYPSYRKRIALAHGVKSLPDILHGWDCGYGGRNLFVTMCELGCLSAVGI